MELKDRLIRSDIRHLENSLKAVSEDLIIVQEFIQCEFASEFLAFLRSRDPDKAKSFLSKTSTTTDSDTAVDHPSQAKQQKLNELGFDKTIGNRRNPPRLLGIKDNEPKNEREVDEVEVFALYPQTEYQDDDNDNADDQDYEARHNLKPDDSSNSGNEQDDTEYDNIASVNKPDSENEKGNASDSDFEPPSPMNLEQGSSGSGKTSNNQGNKQKRKSPKKTSLAKTKRRKKEPLIVKIKEEKASECPICIVSLPSRAELMTHVSEHTEDEAIENQVCPICCLKFVNEQVYSSHMEKGHENIGKSRDPQSRVCSFCNRRCASIQRRVEHERTHTGEKPYKCALCDETFTRLDNQLRHMKRKHDA